MWLLVGMFVGGCMAVAVGAVLDVYKVGHGTPLPTLGSAAITTFFMLVGAAAGVVLSGALK